MNVYGRIFGTLIVSFNLTDHKNELVRALEEVLSDDSFKINVPPTIESRKSSERLLEWCCKKENSDTLNEFTQKLSASLKKVITASMTKSFSYNTDKIWRNFFLLRTSPEFINEWKTFLKGSGVTVKPVLFQHLTDVIYRKSLSDHFRVIYLDQQADLEDLELQDSEKGVLRYVAGYICRHLRKKLERESHEFKEEMVLCLMELVKHPQDSEAKIETDEQWIDLIDRGGLWHVKEMTYQFFRSVEHVIREALMTIKNPTLPLKQEMLKRVIEDNDVQFYWLIVTADFEIDDDEIHKVLLHKIAELYVTVRGFSLASGWLEQYKQQTKKSTQRMKSLRRELHDVL